MGNCMDSCALREERQKTKPGRGEEEEGGIKVKILLTKGELELLMLQLKHGERRLEDVLKEMCKERRDHKEKAKEEGWKPSLESIMECTEVQATD